MKRIDLLQTPEFKKKLENKIVSHITHEFSKAGLELPLPKFRQNMVEFDQAAAQKMANRLRSGAVLMAQALDEMEKS